MLNDIKNMTIDGRAFKKNPAAVHAFAALKNMTTPNKTKY